MTVTTSSDPINHPAHYAAGRFGCECITITRHMTFEAGNAFKYVFRHAEKGGVEDLRKALVYLRWANEHGLPACIDVHAYETACDVFDRDVLPHIQEGSVYEALEQILLDRHSIAVRIVEAAIEVAA